MAANGVIHVIPAILAVSGSPQERTFGQCRRLWVHALRRGRKLNPLNQDAPPAPGAAQLGTARS